MKKKNYVKPETEVYFVESSFICQVSTSGGPSGHNDGDEDDYGPGEKGSVFPSRPFEYVHDDDGDIVFNM